MKYLDCNGRVEVAWVHHVLLDWTRFRLLLDELLYELTAFHVPDRLRDNFFGSVENT